MKFVSIVGVLVVYILSSSFVSAQTTTPTKYANAPAWTLETQDGQKISFSDYEGQPMLIHFWGTWCPFCKKLHPGLEKLRAEYEPKGLVVLGISVNEPIGAKPQDELKKRGINFLTLVEGDDVAIEDFEIAGTPSTFFISPDGRILGSTMESNPDDPRFVQVAEYLVNLPRE